MCIYDRYIALCNSINKSPTAVAIEAGISKSLPTKWKKNPDAVPNGTVLAKLAKYFDIPIDFIYSESEEYAKAIEADPLHGRVQFRQKLDDIPDVPSADEILAAFWGGDDEDLTEEERAGLWQDAIDFIAFRKSQIQKEKRKKSK